MIQDDKRSVVVILLSIALVLALDLMEHMREAARRKSRASDDQG